MSQQINLFNPIFLKQKKYFSAVAMAQALGLILIAMILAVVYVNSQVSRMSREAMLVTNQLGTAQTQSTKTNEEFAARQKSKALESELQKAEAEVKSLQQIFDTLQKGEFGNTDGYSAYLRAFSRQIVDGLWLTGFTIVGAGNGIGLQGRALQPELVPAYIGRLKQESVMQGKSFATLEMQVPQVDGTTPGAVAASAQAAAGDGDASKDKRQVPAAYIEFNLQSSGIDKDVQSPVAKKEQRVKEQLLSSGAKSQ